MAQFVPFYGRFTLSRVGAALAGLSDSRYVIHRIADDTEVVYVLQVAPLLGGGAPSAQLADSWCSRRPELGLLLEFRVGVRRHV